MSASERPVVAVTGGNRGIGKVLAQRFLKDGYAVAVCSRSPRNPDLPDEVMHSMVDVRDRAGLQRFIDAVLQRFRALDVLVNCAGVSRWRALEEIDEAFATEIIETNILGTLWGCQAAAAVLPTGGCIVNVSSLAGKRGSAGNSAYCGAKFAVNGITQALAKELGPRGVRVNAVCPVYVETEQVLEALAEPVSPARGQDVKAYLTSFASAQTALGRLPTADEVAATVRFLASEAASSITGQCLNVDCGAFPQ